MYYRILTLLCGLFVSSQSYAAIFCPPDKTITCHDDIHYLPLTGTPTVFGYPAQLLRYQDQNSNGRCNAGIVSRTWYIDINQNNIFDTGEHACIQKITVQYIENTVTVSFPPDREYTCKDNIINESPDWTSGPCDMIGVSKEDLIFEVAPDACYKILRQFTVINWCTYLPGTPGWNGEGIWKHTQIIKVTEQSKPFIKNCEPVIIGTDANCEAVFSVSNSAFDPSVCGNQLLQWTVEIDLWSDGSTDHIFGFNQSGDKNLKAVKNDEVVTVTLGDKFRPGHHKVIWKVRDQCGNNTSCIQKVHIKDIKKPTPYLHDFLSAAFQGKVMDLMVPARMFNIGSFDNCTKASLLKFSFSPNVNDTIRIVNCNNAGFQLYTIYITDLEDNQEKVDVFLLAFDNGSCSSTLRLSGKVTESTGQPMRNVNIIMLRPDTEAIGTRSDQNGIFTWNNISLYQDALISPDFDGVADDRVDIADLVMLQDYLMGNISLKNYQWAAADVDGDQRIRVKDLDNLKSMILNKEQYNGSLWRFAADLDTLEHVSKLKTIKNSLKLIESDGEINFTGIRLGDLTGANEKTSSSRSNLDLKMSVMNNTLEFRVEQRLFGKGMQIELSLPADLNPKNINVSGQDKPFLLYKDQNTQKVRFIVTQDIDIPAHETLFSITIEDSANHESIQLTPWSKIVLNDYSTLSLRKQKDQSSKDNITVFPNPAKSSFFVEGTSYQLLDIKDARGKSIPFIDHGNEVICQAPSGLYLVIFKTQNGTVTKKIRLIE